MLGLTRRIPDGYSAADLFPGNGTPPLRVCVLRRDEPDGVGGRFVVVRDVLDASVYLGCVLDASGGVDAWIEIWTQRVDALGDARGGSVTNASLEARWCRTVEGLSASAADLLIRTGYETENPPAFGIDHAEGVAARAMHEPSGSWWDVCRDEDALTARGLPSYRSSLARHLWVESLGADSPVVDLSDADAVRSSVLTGVNRHLEPFNLQGGLLMVRRFAPVSYADHVGVVGGRSWSGVPHGLSSIDLREGHGTVTRVSGFGGDPEPVDPDRLFLGRQGRWGRLVEALHLKIKMLAEAVTAARAVVEKTGRPLLNLTDESFRVELWDAGVGLPRLWTTRIRLVDPGTAHEMGLSSSEAGGVAGLSGKAFVSPDGIGRGVYRPEVASDGAQGRCDLRIREVRGDDPAGAVIEATFRSDERAPADGSELVTLRVPIAGERRTVHGRLRSDTAMGPGELRFRSLPVRLADEPLAALRAAEGVPLRDVAFESVPLASTPCDLHALGVLGVRTLLVDQSNTLAIALDELTSLCRAAAESRGGDGAVPIADAFERAFFADDRWAASLGPQRLVTQDVPPSQALDLIPSELWVRVLATLGRMLLGVSDASHCRDVGDTRGLAPHVVFDAALAELADLLVRTRSLIVVDWRHNREVHAVVRGFRTGMQRADDAGIPTLG